MVAKFNLRVTIPGYCATSRYCNPEVAQPPGYNIRILCNLRKLHILQVTIPGNCPTKQKENCYDLIEFFQESFFSNNFRVWLPGGCATSGLLYPEIVQPPGIVTQKLHNLRVTIPGNRTTSGYSNPEISSKKNLFS